MLMQRTLGDPQIQLGKRLFNLKPLFKKTGQKLQEDICEGPSENRCSMSHYYYLKENAHFVEGHNIEAHLLLKSDPQRTNASGMTVREECGR